MTRHRQDPKIQKLTDQLDILGEKEEGNFRRLSRIMTTLKKLRRQINLRQKQLGRLLEADDLSRREESRRSRRRRDTRPLDDRLPPMELPPDPEEIEGGL